MGGVHSTPSCDNNAKEISESVLKGGNDSVSEHKVTSVCSNIDIACPAKVLDIDAAKIVEKEGKLFLSEVGSETSKMFPVIQTLQSSFSINNFSLGTAVIVTALIGSLGGNYIWKCSKFVQSKRILRQIRKSTGYNHRPIGNMSIPRNPSLQSVINSSLPVMIMGPTGSGKSSYLKSVAYKYSCDNIPWYQCSWIFPPKPTVFNRPVFYLSLRSIIARYERKSPADPSNLSLANTSRAILRNVIAPAAAPWIQSIISALSSKPPVDEIASSENNALHSGITTLFDAMRDTYEERLRSGANAEEARPMLIVDEIDELVRSEAEGENDSGVFKVLCDKVAENVVKEHTMHFVVAGSPHSLHQAFDLTTLHWNRFELPDVPLSNVLPILIEKGYDEKRLQECVNVIGTRIGLLMQITPGHEKESLNSICNTSLFTLRQLFYALQDSDLTGVDNQGIFEQEKRLINTLDHLANEGTIGHNQIPLGLRLKYSLLCSRVFYARADSLFCFQNDILKSTWLTHRENILTSF